MAPNIWHGISRSAFTIAHIVSLKGDGNVLNWRFCRSVHCSIQELLCTVSKQHSDLHLSSPGLQLMAGYRKFEKCTLVVACSVDDCGTSLFPLKFCTFSVWGPAFCFERQHKRASVPAFKVVIYIPLFFFLFFCHLMLPVYC